MMDWKILDLLISSLQFEMLATDDDVAIVLSFCNKRERERGPMLRDAGAETVLDTLG